MFLSERGKRLRSVLPPWENSHFFVSSAGSVRGKMRRPTLGSHPNLINASGLVLANTNQGSIFAI